MDKDGAWARCEKVIPKGLEHKEYTQESPPRPPAPSTLMNFLPQLTYQLLYKNGCEGFQQR